VLSKTRNKTYNFFCAGLAFMVPSGHYLAFRTGEEGQTMTKFVEIYTFFKR